jgi:hypothetical protein
VFFANPFSVVLSPNIERRLRLGCRCLSVGRNFFQGCVYQLGCSQILNLGKSTLRGTSDNTYVLFFPQAVHEDTENDTYRDYDYLLDCFHPQACYYVTAGSKLAAGDKDDLMCVFPDYANLGEGWIAKKITTNIYRET